MRVYIAGPMRGYDHYNFPAFDKAKFRLLHEGFEVISPADMDRIEWPDWDWSTNTLPPDFDIRTRLLEDIRAISTCDSVFVLPGYQSSKGAMAEVAFAEGIGIPIGFNLLKET